MKKYILLSMLLMLLLPSPSLAAKRSDRSVALAALQSHTVSEKRFRQASLSSAFVSDWKNQSQCIEGVFEGIDASAMSDDEAVEYIFSIALIASFDFMAAASSDARPMVEKEAARLQKVSQKLKRSAAKKRGRVIARSLLGHKQAIQAFLGLQGSVDYCVMKAELDSAGYTTDSLDDAFERGLAGTWLGDNAALNRFAIRLERGTTLVGKGSAAMQKVKPRLSIKRISSYSNIATLAIGSKNFRALEQQFRSLQPTQQRSLNDINLLGK